MVTSAMERQHARSGDSRCFTGERRQRFGEQCSSAELHAFIDGRSTLDKTLSARPGSFDGSARIPEQSGVSAWAPKVSPSCMANSGGKRRRDPISPLCRRRRPSSKLAANNSPRHGCRGWRPARSAGGAGDAGPPQPDPLRRGVSGTVRCLAADAAFLLAPADDAWVVVDLAGPR